MEDAEEQPEDGDPQPEDGDEQFEDEGEPKKDKQPKEDDDSGKSVKEKFFDHGDYCNICRLEYPKQLKDHLKHHRALPHKCPSGKCKRPFENKADLLAHCQRNHQKYKKLR